MTTKETHRSLCTGAVYWMTAHEGYCNKCGKTIEG